MSLRMPGISPGRADGPTLQQFDDEGGTKRTLGGAGEASGSQCRPNSMAGHIGARFLAKMMEGTRSKTQTVRS